MLRTVSSRCNIRVTAKLLHSPTTKLLHSLPWWWRVWKCSETVWPIQLARFWINDQTVNKKCKLVFWINDFRSSPYSWLQYQLAFLTVNDSKKDQNSQNYWLSQWANSNRGESISCCQSSNSQYRWLHPCTCPLDQIHIERYCENTIYVVSQQRRLYNCQRF